MTQLINVIKVAKPTILVGTSTNAGAFTKEVVEAMCENTARPVIFLSRIQPKIRSNG